jgi:hypothetical protein
VERLRRVPVAPVVPVVPVVPVAPVAPATLLHKDKILQSGNTFAKSQIVAKSQNLA